jgi:hypothetical protein
MEEEEDEDAEGYRRAAERARRGVQEQPELFSEG